MMQPLRKSINTLFRKINSEVKKPVPYAKGGEEYYIITPVRMAVESDVDTAVNNLLADIVNKALSRLRPRMPEVADLTMIYESGREQGAFYFKRYKNSDEVLRVLPLVDIWNESLAVIGELSIGWKKEPGSRIATRIAEIDHNHLEMRSINFEKAAKFYGARVPIIMSHDYDILRSILYLSMLANAECNNALYEDLPEYEQGKSYHVELEKLLYSLKNNDGTVTICLDYKMLDIIHEWLGDINLYIPEYQGSKKEPGLQEYFSYSFVDALLSRSLAMKEEDHLRKIISKLEDAWEFIKDDVSRLDLPNGLAGKFFALITENIDGTKLRMGLAGNELPNQLAELGEVLEKFVMALIDQKYSRDNALAIRARYGPLTEAINDAYSYLTGKSSSLDR